LNKLTPDCGARASIAAGVFVAAGKFQGADPAGDSFSPAARTPFKRPGFTSVGEPPAVAFPAGNFDALRLRSDAERSAGAWELALPSVGLFIVGARAESLF
jgi:hypothetical protein